MEIFIGYVGNVKVKKGIFAVLISILILYLSSIYDRQHRAGLTNLIVLFLAVYKIYPTWKGIVFWIFVLLAASFESTVFLTFFTEEQIPGVYVFFPWLIWLLYQPRPITFRKSGDKSEDAIIN